MALVDWVRHSLPLKLHDGKRHLFPTIASMVYKDDGETKITDENGLLNADKLGGKEASAYALADHTHNFNNETGSSVELDATLTQTGKAADAGAVGEKLSELKEKNDAQDEAINGKLEASALPTAINAALEQAKASGQFDGAPGAPGEAGQAATIEIVGADSLPYGSAPTVTEEAGSTAQARRYKLRIPEGKPGENGEGGGASGEWKKKIFTLEENVTSVTIDFDEATEIHVLAKISLTDSNDLSTGQTQYTIKINDDISNCLIAAPRVNLHATNRYTQAIICQKIGDYAFWLTYEPGFYNAYNTPYAWGDSHIRQYGYDPTTTIHRITYTANVSGQFFPAGCEWTVRYKC